MDFFCIRASWVVGLFIGFHGKFNEGGLRNDENPLIYADPETGEYFHFIRGQQPGIGHLIGALSTRDALYVADLASGGNVGNAKGQGVIYKIRSLAPEPPFLEWSAVEGDLRLNWDRGRLYEAADLSDDWTPVEASFSPHEIVPDGNQRFFRVGY